MKWHELTWQQRENIFRQYTDLRKQLPHVKAYLKLGLSKTIGNKLACRLNKTIPFNEFGNVNKSKYIKQRMLWRKLNAYQDANDHSDAYDC